MTSKYLSLATPLANEAVMDMVNYFKAKIVASKGRAWSVEKDFEAGTMVSRPRIKLMVGRNLRHGFWLVVGLLQIIRDAAIYTYHWTRRRSHLYPTPTRDARIHALPLQLGRQLHCHPCLVQLYHFHQTHLPSTCRKAQRVSSRQDPRGERMGQVGRPGCRGGDGYQHARHDGGSRAQGGRLDVGN